MLDFGAVVEYMEAPGNEVLLHVSELAWERTDKVSDVVNMGDVFDVKYFGVDPRTRKEKVSRKRFYQNLKVLLKDLQEKEMTEVDAITEARQSRRT